MKTFSKLLFSRIILIMFLLVFVGTLTTSNLNGLVIGTLLMIILIVVSALILFGHLFKFNYVTVGQKVWLVVKQGWTALGLMVVLQLTLVTSLMGVNGFNSGLIKWAVTSNTLSEGSYLYNDFVRYPNHFSLMLIERGIYHVTRSMGVTNLNLVFVILNIILIDGAMAILYLILRRSLKRMSVWGLVPICILLSPRLVVFSNDSLLLFSITLVIFAAQLLIIEFNSGFSNYVKIILTNVMLGCGGFMAYLARPSSFILGLVLLVAMLVAIGKRKHKNAQFIKGIILGALILILTIGGLTGINQKNTTQQTIITNNSALKLLPSYYVMLGMNASTMGNYSQIDEQYSASFTKRNAQRAANTKVIKQRLKKFGVIGYVRFLVQKNYHTTSDGTFAGLLDEPQGTAHFKFIRSFFFKFDKHVMIYKTIAQVFWIMITLGLLLSILDTSPLMRILQLTQFSFLIVLLISEGGDGSFMLGLVPITYVLALVGWSRLRKSVQDRSILQVNSAGITTLVDHLIPGTH